MKKLLTIKPYIDGVSAAITVYTVESGNGDVWFTGDYQECEDFIDNN